MHINYHPDVAPPPPDRPPPKLPPLKPPKPPPLRLFPDATMIIGIM